MEDSHYQSLSTKASSMKRKNNSTGQSYNLNNSQLSTLAGIIEEALKIYASAVQSSQKNKKSILQHSQEFFLSKKFDQQHLKIVKLAIALTHFKIYMPQNQDSKRKDLIELLVQYFAYRYINQDYSEEKFFEPILNLSENDFLEDSFSILESMNKSLQFEFLQERYEYLKKRPLNKSASLYILWRLKQIPDLTITQADFLNKQIAVRNSTKCTNPGTFLMAMKKHFVPFYVYKASLKYLLHQDVKSCVDDLTKVNPQDIQDKQVDKIYGFLKGQLLKRTVNQYSIQASAIQAAEIYLKFGMKKQLIKVIMDYKRKFSLESDKEINQLKIFLNIEKKLSPKSDRPDIQEQRRRKQPRKHILSESKEGEIRRVKVLNIVGGGIKAFFALLLLSEMECRVGRPIYEIFDFFVGTSIGGIICACLASKKFSARELLIKIQGKTKNRIFHDISFGRNTVGYSFRLIIKGSVYLKQNIQKACMDLIGIEQLSQTAQWKDFAITSVFRQKDQFFPCCFYKINQKKGLRKVLIEDNSKLEFQEIKGFDKTNLWQILRATSAAYPIFPKVTINDMDFYDGGFIFNNPSLIALRLLELDGIGHDKIKMLNIQLSKNQQKMSFKLSDGILQQSDNMLSLVNSSLTNIREALTHVLEVKSNIADFCSKKSNEILGENLKEFNLCCSYLEEKIESLPHMKLDHVDFATMRVYVTAAEYLINYLDSNNTFNQICLLFSQVLPPLNNQGLQNRYITRYEQNKNSYAGLNRLFQNGELNCSESLLAKKLENFRFPSQLSPQQVKIELPRRVKNIPFLRNFFKEHPFAHALSIGHLPSISYYLGKNYSEESTFVNSWNALHVCIANDQFLSLHTLISKSFFSHQSHAIQNKNVIDYANLNMRRRNRILHQISRINSLLNKEGDIRFIFPYKISGKAFLKHFKSDNVKQYLIRLNKKLLRLNRHLDINGNQEFQIVLE